MSVFKKKQQKNKILKVKVEESDLNRVDAINKKLSELGGDNEFDIEEVLYQHLISTLNSAEKELKKLSKPVANDNSESNSNSASE
tara:strand:+ start:206 stop:460 length:255 start_codon:yes stop_codon:yes gene_type:complete